jgi:transcriptional regulator with XRE-family HTH domain
MDDTQSEDDHNPLPRRLTERRTALRLTKTEAARRAGVGRMTWWAWEEGRRRPYDANYVGIEDAMEWPSGTVQSLADSGAMNNESTAVESVAVSQSYEEGDEWTEEDEEFYEAISEKLRRWGLRPTRQMIETMREEFGRSSLENDDKDRRGGSTTAS